MNRDSLVQSRFALWLLAETVAAMVTLVGAADASPEPCAQSHRPLLAADLFTAGFISFPDLLFPSSTAHPRY
jgi:hypothetical protein